MKQTPSIKLKAAFLLVVFALNTVVGFACSVGMDMGFNSKHHHNEEATEAVIHTHKDGEQHVHHQKKDNHSHNKSHQDNFTSSHNKSGDDKDDCCNGKVKSFQQLDKAVPNSVSLVHPVFFTAFLASYYNINILPHTNIVKDIKSFVRSYHPPIPDIRIAIQSFQI